MDAYVAMGCRPTWTCAPYQLPDRPAFGEHVAWAESNAIVFANSVLGARTNRYGDFIDICCGRHRHGCRTTVCTPTRAGAPPSLLRLERPAGPAARSRLLVPRSSGHLLGRRAGTEVAAIEGLPADAIGGPAQGARRRGGELGIRRAVPRGRRHAGGADAGTRVAAGRSARGARSRSPISAPRATSSPRSPDGAEIGAVSVGTPHASAARARAARGARGAGPPGGPVLREHRPRAARRGRRRSPDDLADAGVTVVTDTCTYITPVLARRRRARDDRLRQVGLVRAEQPRLRRRRRQPRGVRSLGRRRPRHPRRRPLGRADGRSDRSSRRRASGTGARPRRAAELLGRPRSRHRARSSKRTIRSAARSSPAGSS